jgi:predicted ester cyclase
MRNDGRVREREVDVSHHRITNQEAERYKKQVERGFNQRDTRLIEQLLGPHLIDHNVLLGGADIRQRIAITQDALEDATFEIEEYIFEGNAIAWKWSVTGTHTKPLMNIPATGKKVTVRGLSAGIIKDGQLISHWEFSDDASLLAQLEEATGTTAEPD